MKKSNSITGRLKVIIATLIILLVPMFYLNSIVKDRVEYKNEAVQKIQESWAKEQTIEAPYIIIAGKRIDSDKLNAEIKISTETRKKGIFKTPVYTADVLLKGEFLNTNGRFKNTDGFLNFKVTDNRGFVSLPEIKLGEGDFVSTHETYYKKHLNIAGDKLPFEIKFKLRGTNKIFVQPNAKDNTILISGNWKSPSYEGRILPNETTKENCNFSAKWSIPSIAVEKDKATPTGVHLMTMMDSYRMAERAVKYAFLFLSLTFLTYFIYEITNKQKIRIHPLQYLMIGGAMLIFYLLLISISEYLHFGFAYLIAALMTVGLIGAYTYIILTKRNKPFSVAITAILSLLYVFLYVLLNLEDLALLAGSLALFVILGLVMFATKDVKWYEEENQE